MGDTDTTPEQDITVARQALAAGDLKHALHHVGCAMASNPMNPEWMGLMNQILGQTQDPLALVATGAGDTSFVDAANKSYVLAWLRRWEEALDLITDVAEIRPDIPYLTWCEWWMSQPGVLPSMSLDSLIGGIVIDLLKIASSCPVPTPADDPRLPNLQSGARVLAGIRALHPREGMLWFGSSMVARRLGNAADALGFAQYAYQLDASWKSAIGVANALRDASKIDEAAQWFRRALDHDKTDVSAHLDMGDMFLDANRLDDATRAYEQALRKEADHPWATASLLFVRYQQHRDPNQRLALLRLTEDDPPNRRARMLCDQLEPPALYVNRLPAPADASANALNAIFEEMFDNPAKHHGSTVRLKLSHIESPSVVGAFWLQMEMWGPQVALDYQVEKIQEPDPRRPKAQVPFSIWSWDGTQPRPNVPRPDGNVVIKIHHLAGEPFSLEVWTPIAERTAREVGSAGLPHLLATLVFPPRPPGSSWRVLNWVQRAQVATCLVIAHLDGPWVGSPRQQALYSLLYGPTDWTTGAACVALGALARKDPAIRAEVGQAFQWLMSQIPAEGFCCWELPLVATWLTFPDLDEVTRKRLEAYQEKIFDNKTGSSSTLLCAIEAKQFDQQAEVGRAQQAAQVMAQGGGGDPDPVVFAGQRVGRLSDYVGLMKSMQTGNMMGALGQYGLDMMGYASVATAWGQKLAGDAVLNAKFAQMMAR